MAVAAVVVSAAVVLVIVVPAVAAAMVVVISVKIMLWILEKGFKKHVKNFPTVVSCPVIFFNNSGADSYLQLFFDSLN
jgi:hypothetical protein